MKNKVPSGYGIFMIGATNLGQNKVPNFFLEGYFEDLQIVGPKVRIISQLASVEYELITGLKLNIHELFMELQNIGHPELKL
jgi:hypothetical protein